MPHIYLTQSQLDKIHTDYKSDTHILQLHQGTTQSIPYSIIGPRKTLTCCSCGTQTKGRQWYNRDKGFGICPSCYKEEYTKAHSAYSLEVREMNLYELRSNYGVYGVHFGKLQDFILQS